MYFPTDTQLFTEGIEADLTHVITFDTILDPLPYIGNHGNYIICFYCKVDSRLHNYYSLKYSIDGAQITNDTEGYIVIGNKVYIEYPNKTLKADVGSQTLDFKCELIVQPWGPLPFKIATWKFHREG